MNILIKIKFLLLSILTEVALFRGECYFTVQQDNNIIQEYKKAYNVKQLIILTCDGIQRESEEIK